jgi:hypothetical protein
MTSIPRPQQKLAKKFNTLQILRGGWYTTWAVSLLLLVISIVGVNNQRQAIKTVGKDAAPSILTAQQLRDSFADLDASLANELLSKPGQNRQVLADFEKNRKKIANRLVAAAKNITYPAEEKIVQNLQFNGSGYLLKLQEARDAHNRNDAVGALNIYRSAMSLVERDLLPQAEQLAVVNYQELDKTYSFQNFTNGGIALLIGLVGLIQIGILVSIQIFLYQRMRRVLNLPLLGASAISAVFLLYTIGAFIGSTNDLKVAREDAFESIHTLRQARALSYMANADESRYLLDKANADVHDRAFKSNIAKLVTLPSGKSLTDVIKQIPQADRELKFKLDGLTGLYANELNNITFSGELAATIDTLKTLDVYLKIDEQIRQLYRSGKIAEAITLTTGYEQGQSNWAFEKYLNSSQKLREINETVFYTKIESGNNKLNYFEIIAPIALGSVAILTLFGLRPRLNEYL